MPGLKSLDGPALKTLAEAPYGIYPEHNLDDYNPNPLQSFNDFSYERLQKLQREVDPKGVFKGPFTRRVIRA